MSLKAMTSLARVTRLRSACAPTSGLPKRVPFHPDCATFWFIFCSLTCKLHLQSRGRAMRPIPQRAGAQHMDFSLHRITELLVAFGQLLERPIERTDGIGRGKDRQRKAVPFFLKFPKCVLAAFNDCCCSAFRIA